MIADHAPARQARRRATARCRIGRCRRRGCISTATNGTRCCRSARVSPSRRSPSPMARPASMAAAAGPVFAQSGRRPGHQRVRPVARAGGALERRGPPHRHRRLDPRLARAPGPPAARARLQGRRRRKTIGPRSAARQPAPSRWSCSASSAASSPTGWRWSASRTCWASASPARRAGASGPISSSPRPPKSPRATWSCTRNTASAAMTGWRR